MTDQNTLTEEDVLFVRSLCMRGFDKNNELGNDCFLYVFEKLYENESRRINAFQGKSSFRTFLYSVTSKLIIDFRRTRFGYKVLPKYYWGFDKINRYAFKLFFYRKLTPDWVENTIRAEFRITEEEAQRRVDEVEKRIRESRIRMETPAEKQAVLLGEEVENIASEKGTNPEESMLTAEFEQKRGKVLNALKEEIHKLEDEDALILQLYFEQGLTAKEVSGAVPGTNEKMIYRKIGTILKNLRKYLREKGITDGDIKEIFERL